MSITLQPIRPFHPQFNPDPDWKRLGLTPTGHQLFEETTKRSRAVPDIDPATGERRHRLHPTTGEPLYPRNKPQPYDHVRTFYLESQGNGNIVKIDWREPTPKEIAAVEREEGIKAMIPNLSATLYDADIKLEDLVAAMKMIAQATKGELPDEAPPAESEAPEPPPRTEEVVPPPPTTSEARALFKDEAAGAPTVSEPAVTYPHMYAPGGRYLLSDGTKMRCKKVDAEAAETALHEVAAVP